MKNFKKTALALVVTLVAGYGVYTSQKKSELSELALTNIEALADCELLDGTLPNGYCRKDDYNNYFCGSSHWWYSDNCLQ